MKDLLCSQRASGSPPLSPQPYGIPRERLPPLTGAKSVAAGVRLTTHILRLIYLYIIIYVIYM